MPHYLFSVTVSERDLGEWEDARGDRLIVPC